MEEHIAHSLCNKTMDGSLTGCQISVRFGMNFILLKMLHSFSCLTKLISHCSSFIIINRVSNVNYSSIGQLFLQIC